MMLFSKLKLKKIDKNIYQLKEPLQFGSYIVPAGFKTDLASTPKWIQWLYPHRNKHYTKSSIIHDYLYDEDKLSRVKCDWIFLKAMKVEGFCFIGRWIFYISVRIFGGAYR